VPLPEVADRQPTFMSSITKRLIPSFLREPAVALIGEKCYVTLVEDLNVFDTECLKYAISKGLGLGIVVGGSIMKVPQFLLIVSARSARGLSLLSYSLETLSYAITLAYSARHNFPFSTYGENFFLTIQNIIITLLIVYYAPRSNATSLVLAVVLTAVAGFVLYQVPLQFLALLQVSTLPLTFLSKLPQIMSNYRLKSTGRLSAFAVIASIAGCIARLFTTATELNDPIVFLGFLGATILNIVIGAQMWAYWNADGAKAKEDEKMEEAAALTSPGKVEPPVPPTPSAASRRWTRKLD